MIGKYNDYTLIRAVHPSNNKRGGVYIYYRESLAVELVETNYLSERLLCKFSINNKKVSHPACDVVATSHLGLI